MLNFMYGLQFASLTLDNNDPNSVIRTYLDL